MPKLSHHKRRELAPHLPTRDSSGWCGGRVEPDEGIEMLEISGKHFQTVADFAVLLNKTTVEKIECKIQKLNTFSRQDSM